MQLLTPYACMRVCVCVCTLNRNCSSTYLVRRAACVGAELYTDRRPPCRRGRPLACLMKRTRAPLNAHHHSTHLPLRPRPKLYTTASVNDPPTASPRAYSADQDIALAVPALTGLLAGASDVDGDTLIVTGVTSPTAQGGAVTFAADGSFVYVPKTAYIGSDDFTFTISDNKGGSVSASASITVGEFMNYSRANDGHRQPVSPACACVLATCNPLSDIHTNAHNQNRQSL